MPVPAPRGWLVAPLFIVTSACANEVAPPGGGGAGGAIEMPPPQGPLPAVTPTETERFTTSGACNQCHFAGESAWMHDPVTDEDLSPGFSWRSSMMALAARDPYYLAVFSEERGAAADPAAIDAICTRCHAPAGSEERAGASLHLTFDDLVAGESPEANLGRDGVTCSLCHQIADASLGEPETFTGGFTVGFARAIYGPHLSPRTDPMEFFVAYTPTYSEHMMKSELCATCHTVITPVVDDGEHVGDFVEQAPYFEWLNSSFADTTPCQTCHLPRVDASWTPIATPIATYPDNLSVREPFGVHSFEGANSYMLGLLAENVEWSGSGLAPAELESSRARSVRHLESAATLTLADPESQADALVVAVRVDNQTGHKLPTGYPGRRLWLHVRATDAGGGVVFESGGWNADGSIVDAAGARLDDEGVVMPHRDVVSSSGQVALWESIPGGWESEPTFLPLSAVAYAKDNRILPTGWSDAGDWTQWTHPVGVESDVTFLPGRDTVTFELPLDAAHLRAELVYQSVPPAAIEHLARVPTPAAVRFSQMAERTPPAPVVIASSERDL